MQKLLLFSLASLFFTVCNAQSIGIGTVTPNTNAVLDISSTSKGLLIPRMDSISRKNIPGANGMLVFDTDTRSTWYHDGTGWVNMPPRGSNKGDLLYWNGNSWVALPVGTSGQYLGLSAGGNLAWSSVNTGGSGSNINTQNISNISPTTVQCGGIISSDGGAAITARGVVWNTSPNPTIALSTKTNDGTGIGSFVSNPVGLTPAATYYIRAYYTNANGTTYGNQVTFATLSSFSIGQNYGGGKIFYVDNTGQHGLIVSLNDLSTGIKWYNITDVETNATGLAIGTGAANTTAIITAQGNGSYAASLCRQFYNGGGFTDWYLPSFYELNQLNIVSNTLGFTNWGGNYWSSSETSQYSALRVFIDPDFPVPNQQDDSKGNTLKVRAIRRF